MQITLRHDVSQRYLQRNCLFSRQNTSSFCTTVTCNASSKAASNTLIPLSFSSGFFRFSLPCPDNRCFVLSYWTPVTLIPMILQDELVAESKQDLIETEATSPKVQVFDVTSQPIDLAATKPPLSLGMTLKEGHTISIPESGLSLQLSPSFTISDLRRWESREVPPPSYRELVLQREKERIMSSYKPLSQEFLNLLMESESQASRRFKYGGLFLLSAQLGFFVRLIWWDYSWDVMEPITWCMTYSMMLGTFAYYIVFSQEFMLPLAEKRAVQERFWKNVHKRGFDIEQFKRLRRKLLNLDRKTTEAKLATPSPLDSNYYHY